MPKAIRDHREENFHRNHAIETSKILSHAPSIDRYYPHRHGIAL